MARQKSTIEKTVSKPPESTRADSSVAASSLHSMQGHFLATGFYRPEDIHRLLGDPRDRVEGKVNVDPCFSFLQAASKVSV